MNPWDPEGTAPTAARAFCDECGSELAPGRLASRCPNCLLQLALDRDDERALAEVGDTPGGASAGARRPEPARIGRAGEYELVEEIGRGGMGAVYRARHRTLNRWVALKRIRLERWDNPDWVMRFQIESEAIARLDHPGIVPLLETGECEGLQYFTMKLVEGGSLADRWRSSNGGGIDPGGESPGRRSRAWVRGWVACLLKICDAVHYAHQRGVIHRDLKPANILLDRDGEPMISDFGLAKILEQDSGITQTRAALGSPNYMAPEQASGDSARISTGVDVYSLGAMLYEVLTGEPPFKSPTALETMRRVVEEPPRRPRSIDPGADPDLETVCLKCLEKDPRARYASAADLAEDLRHWLDGQPVRSRPVGQAELLLRWCRRNPALAAALGAVVALLVIVAAGATLAAVRIGTAQQETERLLTRMQLEKADRLLATLPAQGLALLSHVVDRHPENPDAAFRLASELFSRDHALAAFEPLVHDSKLVASAPTAAGDAFTTVTERGILRVFSIPSGRLILETNSPTGRVVAAAFATDAPRLALATVDGGIQVWRTEPAPSLEVSFPSQARSSVWPLFIHPTGRLVGVVTRFDRSARFLNVETETIELQIDEESSVTGGAFSADGRWVALGRGDGVVSVWDVERRERVLSGMRHGDYVNTLAFSPDRRFLASSSADQTARVWDLAGGAKEVLRIDHKHEVTDVRFSGDGRLVATAALDRTAQVWDFRTARPLVDPVAHSEGLISARILPENGYLTTTTYRNLAWLWQLRPAQVLPIELDSTGGVTALEVSPDGSRIVVGDCEGAACVWDIPSKRRLGPRIQHGDDVSFAAFSADNRRLITASFDRTIQVRDLDTGRTRVFEHDNWVRTARFDASGRRIVSASHDRTARIWDLDTGASLPLQHRDEVIDAVFGRQGRYVGTASKDRSACLWDAADGRLLARLPHDSYVSSIRFSPDDQYVVTASFDNTARVWRVDAAAGSRDPTPFLTLRHEGEIAHATFSADGSWVVTSSFDRSARIWNARSGEPKPYHLPHDEPVLHASFSPDGRWVATASRDGSARLWSVDSGLPVTAPMRHGETVSRVRFTPDGNAVVTGSHDGKARIWPLPVLGNSDGPWLADLGRYISRLTVDSHDQFKSLAPAELERLNRRLRSDPSRPAFVAELFGSNDRR